MMKLINTTKNQTIATEVTEATSFLDKALGLMGRKQLPPSKAVLFKGTRMMPANSIQTTFMRFALDVIFLDENLKVLEVVNNVKPWRMTWPVSGAINAVEMTAGALTQSNIAVGDQLHVGD